MNKHLFSSFFAACRRRLDRRRRSTVVGCGVFVFFFFYSQLSLADYSWKPSISGGSTATYPSPDAACRSIQTALVFSHIEAGPGNTFNCYFKNGGSTVNYGYASRVGTPCTPPSVYNPDTGICDQPPKDCSSEVGVPILSRGSNGSAVQVGQRRYVDSSPPSTACVDSCRYVSESSSSTSCYLVSGSTDTGFCNYILKGNGESCSGWDWNAPETGDPLNPPQTPDVPPSDPDDPGCPPGWSWSGTTCVRDTPPDPGEGDGEGNCDPSKDPSCAPGSVSGPGCDQPLVCTGDVVSCAILTQQKDMRCHAEEQADYESKKTDIDSLFQGDKFEIEEQNVDVPSFVDRATTFLPRTCPADQRISVSSGSISMSYEPLCVLAEGFSWIFVAFTAVFCAIYVGAAFGGNE